MTPAQRGDRKLQRLIALGNSAVNDAYLEFIDMPADQLRDRIAEAALVSRDSPALMVVDGLRVAGLGLALAARARELVDEGLVPEVARQARDAA